MRAQALQGSGGEVRPRYQHLILILLTTQTSMNICSQSEDTWLNVEQLSVINVLHEGIYVYCGHESTFIYRGKEKRPTLPGGTLMEGRTWLHTVACETDYVVKYAVHPFLPTAFSFSV